MLHTFRGIIPQEGDKISHGLHRYRPHKNSSYVCILTEDDELIERRIRTDRESFDKLFADKPLARIPVEDSTDSEWVARHLEALGHEVVVADPNFAPMDAIRDRRIKTGKRDARALCEAYRLGAYRPAHRTSDRQRNVRLTSRYARRSSEPARSTSRSSAHWRGARAVASRPTLLRVSLAARY